MGPTDTTYSCGCRRAGARSPDSSEEPFRGLHPHGASAQQTMKGEERGKKESSLTELPKPKPKRWLLNCTQKLPDGITIHYTRMLAVVLMWAFLDISYIEKVSAYPCLQVRWKTLRSKGIVLHCPRTQHCLWVW